MRWIINTRVSSKEQSTESQRKECEEYVKKHMKAGDEIIYIDEPDSSTRKKWQDRPKLMELLKIANRGDTVVVFKLDRIARKGTELVYIYTDKLVAKGVKVISLCEPTVDKNNIHIFAMVAEMERDNIGARTAAGLRNKQRRLERTGTPWYGFSVDPNELQTHNPKGFSFEKPYKLVVDEKEAEQVRLILRLHGEGLSYGQIANKLKELGHKNRKGNPIQKMSVYRIIARLKRDSHIVSEVLGLSLAVG